jgi:hypothetical protein
MDELEEKLLALDKRRGKRKVASVSEYCRRNEAYDVLLDIFTESSPRRRGSISWVLLHALQKRRWKPLIGHAERLCIFLAAEREDTMTKRCLMSFFQTGPLPVEHLGLLADSSIKLLKDVKESLAVRAFSISVLMRLAEDFPDLYNEVEEALSIMAGHDKPSIRVRARKAILQMDKISSKG